MATCDVCGNNYDKSFTLQQGGRSGTFDSFECAIHAFAPRCAHCDCAVIGHGVEGTARSSAAHTAPVIQVYRVSRPGLSRRQRHPAPAQRQAKNPRDPRCARTSKQRQCPPLLRWHPRHGLRRQHHMEFPGVGVQRCSQDTRIGRHATQARRRTPSWPAESARAGQKGRVLGLEHEVVTRQGERRLAIRPAGPPSRRHCSTCWRKSRFQSEKLSLA